MSDKTWNGPQDGLPPVGLRVMYLCSDHRGWMEGIVWAHDDKRLEAIVYLDDQSRYRYASGTALRFKNIESFKMTEKTMPIGATVKINMTFSDYSGTTAEVVGYHHDRLVLWMHKDNSYRPYHPDYWGSIEVVTDEQIAVEDMKNSINTKRGRPTQVQICRDIYQAIRNGNVRGVGLTKE